MFTGPFLQIGLHLLPVSFEIHWVGQYLVNFMGLAGIINATVYANEPIFRGLGQTFLIFDTMYMH